MFLRRTVCFFCHNATHQSSKVSTSVHTRSLISAKKTSDEDSELLSSNKENHVRLREEAEAFYEDLKAFYPYETCWRMKDQQTAMFNTTSIPKRLDYMRMISNVENEAMKRLSKKLEKKAERESHMGTEEDGGHKSVCPWLWTRSVTVNKWQAHKLCHAHMYGKDIVIDCGFEKTFLSDKRRLRDYIHGLRKIFQANKQFPYPANIVLCNLAADSELRAFIEQDAAFQPSNSHFLSLHTESYLDLYPKAQLVYLSSDSPYIMKKYDKHTTYIVGGLADTSGKYQRASLAKARQDGVKSQRLPIQSTRNVAKNLVVPFHRMIPLLNIARSTNIETAILKIIPRKDRQMLLQAKSISAQIEIEKARRLAALAKKDA